MLNGIHVHYSDIIMRAMASQVTSIPIVFTAVCSGADQRKYQSSALMVTGGFHSHKKVSNADFFFIWWRHHVVAARHLMNIYPILFVLLNDVWLPCYLKPNSVRWFYLTWPCSKEKYKSNSSDIGIFRNIPGKQGQHHGFCCPSSMRRHVLSKYRNDRATVQWRDISFAVSYITCHSSVCSTVCFG